MSCAHVVAMVLSLCAKTLHSSMVTRHIVSHVDRSACKCRTAVVAEHTTVHDWCTRDIITAENECAWARSRAAHLGADRALMDVLQLLELRPC